MSHFSIGESECNVRRAVSLTQPILFTGSMDVLYYGSTT